MTATAGAEEAGAAGQLLLVDDDDVKRYVIGRWLRQAGFSVVEGVTGAEALALAAQAELVLLDVNLPDMSGFDVCAQLKSDPSTAAIPIIQVSATAVEVADRAYGLTQGADAYLVEPTEPQELLATVNAALRYYRARRRAEKTAALLSRLTSATLDINAAQTFDGLARAAAAGAVAVFDCPAVVMLVLPDGQLRRMSSSPEHLAPVPRGGPVQLAERVAAALLGPGEVSAAGMLDQDAWLRLVPDSTLRCPVSVAVARTKPDRPPVGLTVAQTGVPGPEERQIQRQFVLSVALAVEALRSYAEEHLVAMTLQRSFLPSELPAVPGLAMASRYLPASNQAEIGGDFYEALTRGDRVLVVIGDVQGHSLRAATVMGELRHALRAYANEGHSALAITGLVNESLQRYHPNVLATLCVAELDPASGGIEIVNCGHIPPLIASADGAAYHGEGGLILGLPMHDPHIEHVTLPAGGTLVLVTDGLIEDRKVVLDDNLERLRSAAHQACGADVEAFSNHLIALFGQREDDVALIAVRRD
jgi:CheY-like chemotaxis protein